jgi:hypothetical protein
MKRTLRIWLNPENYQYYVVVNQKREKPLSRGFDTRIEAEIEMERIVKRIGASKC